MSDCFKRTSAAQFSPRHLCLECNHDHHVTGQNGGNLFQWRHIRENVDPHAQLKIINMQKNCCLAERGFDPRTSGLWAQHTSTAPLCFHWFIASVIQKF